MTLEFQDNVNFFLLFWACTVASVKAFTNIKDTSGNKYFIHGHLINSVSGYQREVTKAVIFYSY